MKIAYSAAVAQPDSLQNVLDRVGRRLRGAPSGPDRDVQVHVAQAIGVASATEFWWGLMAQWAAYMPCGPQFRQFFLAQQAQGGEMLRGLTGDMKRAAMAGGVSRLLSSQLGEDADTVGRAASARARYFGHAMAGEDKAGLEGAAFLEQCRNGWLGAAKGGASIGFAFLSACMGIRPPESVAADELRATPARQKPHLRLV